MHLLSWLRPLAARLNRTNVRRLPQRPSFRPRLETLEDRLTPSGGLLDPTFGSGGTVTLPSTTDRWAFADAVQPDGKVVIAGQVYVTNRGTSSQAISVQRLNRDGSLDTTFNQTGSLIIQPGSSSWANAVALQPDGKILVGGIAGVKSSNGAVVARVNPNGTLDTTFGSKGLWIAGSAPVSQVQKLAILTDPLHPGTVTGIVAAADGTANGTACFDAVKLTPAGAPDKTFGSGGIAVLAVAGSFAVGGNNNASLAVSPAGEIYLAGTFTTGTNGPFGTLAAFTPAGALDRTFGGGAGYVTGSQISNFTGVAVQTLTVNGQPVSRILVAGYGSGDNTGQTAFVIAYTPGGVLDTTFGSGGSFALHGPGYTFSSLALEADGSIVAGGFQGYTAADGTLNYEMWVGHLTANGAADTSFGPNGTGFIIVQAGKDSEVWGLAVDPTDGGILACGYSEASRSGGSGPQAAVIRLTAP